MINKRKYIFLFIAFLNFVSLSMFLSTKFVASGSKNPIEYAEKKNNTEEQMQDFSYLSLDLNFIVYGDRLDHTYKNKIYNLYINESLLRPPIFS